MHGVKLDTLKTDSRAGAGWVKLVRWETLRRGVALAGLAAGASCAMVQVAFRRIFNSFGPGRSVAQLVPVSDEVAQSVIWAEHFAIWLGIVAILAGLLTVWRAPRAIAVGAMALGIVGLAGIWYWRFFWAYV